MDGSLHSVIGWGCLMDMDSITLYRSRLLAIGWEFDRFATIGDVLQLALVLGRGIKRVPSHSHWMDTGIGLYRSPAFIGLDGCGADLCWTI